MFRTFAVAFLVIGLSACNKGLTTVQAQSMDPADGNLAPALSDDAQVSQNYGATADYDVAPPDDDPDYQVDSQAIETTEPPPPLPDYTQPEIPGDDYYWTPGYWAWAPTGYYWVPGAWVMAPWVGAVWTPPYWDFYSGYYRWHAGYWGAHVGFYGGINYGFGYTGRGYYGAYWNRGHLNYNRAVTNVNVNIVHNTYNYAAPRTTVGRVSYNGGRGGITLRPTPQERAVIRDRRMPAVAAQRQEARAAATNRAQFASTGQLRQNALVASRPLATNYRAPAAQPPAAARVAQARQNFRPDNSNRSNPGMRQAPQQPGVVPQTQAPPQSRGRFDNNNRPAPVMRPSPQTQPGPVPQQQVQQPRLDHRDGQFNGRRGPDARPAAPQTPTAPQVRPERHDARPENRPQPTMRQAQPPQQREMRPAPQPQAPRGPEMRQPQPQQAGPSPQAAHPNNGGGRGEHGGDHDRH